MNQRYYYMADGKTVGPLEARNIYGLFRARMIDEETLVCIEGGEDWRPLHEFSELAAPHEPQEAKPLPSSSRFAVKPKRDSYAASLQNDEAEVADPVIAFAVRIIAWIVIVGGVFVVLIGWMEGEASNTSLLLYAVASAVSAIFLMAFASLLSWVYAIKEHAETLARRR